MSDLRTLGFLLSTDFSVFSMDSSSSLMIIFSSSSSVSGTGSWGAFSRIKFMILSYFSSSGPESSGSMEIYSTSPFSASPNIWINIGSPTG